MKRTSENPTLKIELYDQDTEKCHPFQIVFDEYGIYIIPKGYGDYYSKNGHGIPIMVEMFGGEPRVILWDDINEEDSTHIISLAAASEKLRKPDKDGNCHNMSNDELDRLRREKIDKIWEEYDLGLGEDDEYVDDDGWETVQPGNEYWRNFYVIWVGNPNESKKHTFTIQFKPGSVEIESAGPDY